MQSETNLISPTGCIRHPRANGKTPGARRGRGGFTLIELIVATAILSILLAGMASVFVASMRAVKAGYQSMDAYTMTRGAFEVLNRDLSTAFTSRDRGEYYSFYGTPYGMIFVGKASGYRGSGEDANPGFVRVSYVLRQVYSGLLSNRSQEYLNQDTIKVTTGTPPRRADQNVYVLVRYVETGLSDLDSYRGVDWSGTAYDGNIEIAPGQFVDLGSNLDQEFASVDGFYNNYTASGGANPNGISPKERDALISAKKRELWLRMLRGNGPVWDPTADTMVELPLNLWVPDYFDSTPLDGVPEDSLLVDALGAPIPKPNVLDYVVARNIVPMEDESNVAGLYATLRDEFRPGYWIFEYMEDAFAYDPNIPNPTAYTALRPRYWNSDRNAGLLLNEVLAGTPSQPADPMYTYGGIGSPLAPHIPGAVRVRLELVFPAPNVGAPDMHRFVDETIDIPTAFKRPPVYLPKEY